MVLLRERKSRLIGFIEPCLPSPAKVPPSGPDWIHEIKHDGIRIMARRDGAGVRLITRNGNDLTDASRSSQWRWPHCQCRRA
jgi:bifunctional non-homologous end joining protein LigD